MEVDRPHPACLFVVLVILVNILLTSLLTSTLIHRTYRPLSPRGRGNKWHLSESLDGHKEKIYGLHDGFETRSSSLPSSSPSSSKDVAADEEKRAAHNKKQASVFDESAR